MIEQREKTTTSEKRYLKRERTSSSKGSSCLQASYIYVKLLPRPFQSDPPLLAANSLGKAQKPQQSSKGHSTHPVDSACRQTSRHLWSLLGSDFYKRGTYPILILPTTTDAGDSIKAAPIEQVDKDAFSYRRRSNAHLVQRSVAQRVTWPTHQTLTALLTSLLLEWRRWVRQWSLRCITHTHT